MSSKTKSGDNFTKKSVWPCPHGSPGHHNKPHKQTKAFMKNVIFIVSFCFMNKQEIWATKAEVCEMLDKVNKLGDKIQTVNDKVDKLIKMVELIDFVKVSATSEFASSSFRFPSPGEDTVSRSPGLPEPEVTEVPEVTEP